MENYLLNWLLFKLEKTINKINIYIFKKAIDRCYPWSIEQIIKFIERSIVQSFQIEVKNPRCNEFLDIINVYDYDTRESLAEMKDSIANILNEILQKSFKQFLDEYNKNIH